MPAFLSVYLLNACNGSGKAPAASFEPPVTDRSKLVREKGAAVLQTLRDTDFKALAAYIQPQTGVRFSPYGYIDLFSDQKLPPQNLLRAVAARTRLSWGSAKDSGGATIVLSPQDYFRRYVYTADFLKADSTAIIQGIPHDDKEQSIGNLYDGADCITYFKTNDHARSSLRLFFATESDKLYLIGLMHDEAAR